MSVFNFREVFAKNKHRFGGITLDNKDVHNCVSYIKNLIFYDLGVHELKSGNDKYKELFSLVCQITAISKLINFPLIDYKDMDTPIIDQFNRYSGKWVGIISFNDGEFPIFYYPIYKKSLFICKVDDLNYYICGYGNQSVINSFSHKSLVLNQNIREQTSMTAFYGLDQLTPIPNNIYEFQNLMK